MQLRTTLLVAALAATLGGAYVGIDHRRDHPPAEALAPPAAAATASLPPSTAATPIVPAVAPAEPPLRAPVPTALPDFANIILRNAPAVVNISVAGSVRSSDLPGTPPMDPDDPLFQFFHRFQAPPGNVPVRSLGSGFIISPDGLILTDAHVIDGAEVVTVKLSDRRQFKAKVIGMDKVTDVAVLRINASNLPVVHFGDPGRTRVGEWVLAIGAPFGFENSATAGIVSAKGRSLPDGGYVPFIQTDAAVNPGSSGGPLFNMNGEVIGINSQIYSRSGGYQGLSFAIPIDVAMQVETELVQHGKIEHGRLGVTIQEVSQPLAQSFGMKNTVGALVSNVEDGAAAAKAGIQPGDIILRLNNTDIARSADLPPLVANMKPGTHARLTVWRKGRAQEMPVTIGGMATEKVAARSANDQGGLGLAVRPLSPQESKEQSVSGGLLVQQASGAAARAGIQHGDILLSANGEPLKNAEQLHSFTSKADKQVALLVSREGSKVFIAVELG